MPSSGGAQLRSRFIRLPYVHFHRVVIKFARYWMVRVKGNKSRSVMRFDDVSILSIGGMFVFVSIVVVGLECMPFLVGSNYCESNDDIQGVRLKNNFQIFI